MEDISMLDQIVKLIFNNGIGIICVAYFMYRDLKFMQKITDTFASLKATLESLEKVNTKLTQVAQNVERRTDNDI